MVRDLDVLADHIRYLTLRELSHLGYGHIGGSLSIVEALSALYGGEMAYDPKNPHWDGRDYFILSKGHSGPVGTLHWRPLVSSPWTNYSPSTRTALIYRPIPTESRSRAST